MLLRHRHARRHLSLPVACQSITRHYTTTKLTPTRPPQRKSTAAHHRPVPNRPLATAVGSHIRQDDLSYDHLRAYQQQPAASPIYHLRSWDPATNLLLKVADDPLPRVRSTPLGVPGGVDEMLSVFDACIHVNQLDRAALVLERLNEGPHGSLLPAADLILLHNQYLRAVIAAAVEQPEIHRAKSIHRWFEVQIVAHSLPYTTETIACMLKASLQSAQGALLRKLITRYMDMVPQESIYALAQGGLLSQQDFGTITSIYQPASDSMYEAWDPILAENDSEQPSSLEGLDVVGEGETEGTTPQVRPVPQKGLGLKSLRGVLSFFDPLQGHDLSKLSKDELSELQAQLEKDCVDSAIQRWKEEYQALTKMGRNNAWSSSRQFNAQIYEWQCAFEQKLQDEFVKYATSEASARKTAEDLERCLYGPFMRQSTPARLAAVTIMSVLNSLASLGADKGVTLSASVSNLSKMVEEDITLQTREKESLARRKDWQRNKSSVSQAAAPNAKVSNILEAPVCDRKSWPATIRAKIGAVLLSYLLEVAKMEVVREHPETKELNRQLQPALAHVTMFRKGKKVGMIIPNKCLVEVMMREPRGDFLAKHLPMLVEPRPWTEFEKGGYLDSPTRLVRLKNGELDQRIYAEAALKRGDLDQVTKAMDVLGRTAWKINNSVFDVMLEAWNTGEAIANIPPLNPKIPIPEEPDATADPTVRREWLRRVKLAENEKSGLHSERCHMNFQLDIARAFKERTFYFPHNMDFRGRAYPVPAYLNHMGADNVRGLLCFGAGKELGETGLRWLKVQLANVHGFDKASLEEREAFAMAHYDDIVDSVTKPLTGKRWWLRAEDPWQCLAACFELKAALESPEPARFVSHLPVQQDGTCNGLQHYAALGGDTWGAQQVNLAPGERPADVYSAVAGLVQKSVTEDVTNGHFLAKAMDGKITRKVVKQTVMTNVYGVTYIGAKAQVLKQINAAYPNLNTETGVAPTLAAAYVTTKIFKALSTMFRGAHDIQYWLGECAGRVCRALTPEQLERIEAGTTPVKERKNARKRVSQVKVQITATPEEILNQFRSTIVWTTPLRMPIVQPYRKTTTRAIRTCMQELTLQVPDRSDPVNRRKQLQAFPPNFIHSLDASHMLLSALECEEQGLSFAAVHDSFWTHAADIDVMNRILRDAFVRIHSEDVIGRLKAEFDARYKGSLYLAKIAQGTELADKLSQLRSDTKLTLKEELLRECERQRYLNSSDPEEVQKGLEMVTPASLYEQHNASQLLSSCDEVEPVGLGDVTNGKVSLEEDAVSKQGLKDDSRAPYLSNMENQELTSRLASINHFQAVLEKGSSSDVESPKSFRPPQPYCFWLPLAFPDIPSKGDFDVKQLKDSKYFFS
ncbi:DNA-dependent RNA polymerase [Xylariaceae sp. FL1019]|nr:DNA-dependent RNA polymerase [Xylariaceae sp. FL1019]